MPVAKIPNAGSESHPQRALKQKVVYRINSHIAWTHPGFYSIYPGEITIQARNPCSQLGAEEGRRGPDYVQERTTLNSNR